MAALATIATVAAGAAAVVGAGATIYNGYQQQKAFDQQEADATQAREDAAHAYEVSGRADFAGAQRDAQERRLQGALTLSQQQAAAAASGGGSGSDAPTIVRLMTETAERTEYGAQSAMYRGQESKNLADQSAANLRATKPGQSSSFVGSLIQGLGQLMGGAASTVNVADRFGILPQPTQRWGWSSLPAT